MSENTQAPPEESWYWRRADWGLSFAWLPHRCAVSNRLIWLERAYHGQQVITGPGSDVVLHWWMTKEEFMVNRIKGVF